jgi:hypothetical protein
MSSNAIFWRSLSWGPFRAGGSLPFGRTTDIFRHLLDDPATRLRRADVIVQWAIRETRCHAADKALHGLGAVVEMPRAPHPGDEFRPVPASTPAS